MGKLVKKAVILLIVFVLALAGYFAWSIIRHEEDNTMYTSIEDANLPVAYVELFGRRMNCIYGFVEDNSACAGRGDLTVLPQDRLLTVVFDEVDSKVKGIQYEIRSLDGEHLVERTTLEEWTSEDGEVRAELPIQNLLAEGEEYRMTLAIATETHPAVYYYTRVVWAADHHMEEMVQLAADFSEKTFHYDTARELTTYLESDLNADNSSLGQVTLKNNFEQLTWRNLGMERVGEVSMHVKELQGAMGTVGLDYVVSRTGEDGSRNYYDVSETFTMKWSSQRIYMMDYSRRVNQVFSGDDNLYSDKRIMLGISDAEEIQSVTDPGGKFRAFVANRALWCYDAAKGESTKVFAFRKSEDDLRSSFQSHGVEILSVSEAGDIDFLVYGYMNRGNHEGTTGVAVYRYERAGNSLTERMYLPSSLDYESLRQDIKTLSFLSGSQNLYLMMDHAVYAVDLAGKEYMVVADGLTEENFAVSTDHSRIAWQDGDGIYDSRRLNVMDLETGKKDEIDPDGDTVIRLVGFVGNDLVYGLAQPGEQFVTDGRVTGIPLYAIEIMGTSMELETRYEKQGICLSEVEIQESRVHLTRVRKLGAGYLPADEDTLVCVGGCSVEEFFNGLDHGNHFVVGGGNRDGFVGSDGLEFVGSVEVHDFTGETSGNLVARLAVGCSCAVEEECLGAVADIHRVVSAFLHHSGDEEIGEVEFCGGGACTRGSFQCCDGVVFGYSHHRFSDGALTGDDHVLHFPVAGSSFSGSIDESELQFLSCELGDINCGICPLPVVAIGSGISRNGGFFPGCSFSGTHIHLAVGAPTGGVAVAHAV